MAFGDLINNPNVDKNRSNFSSNYTLTFAATATSGNLLAVVIHTQTSITPPAGWTKIAALDTLLTDELAICYKISDGTEASYNIVSTGSASVAVLYEFEGPFNSTPLDVSELQGRIDSSTRSTIPFTGITPTAANSVLLCAGGHISGSALWTGIDAGFTSDVLNYGNAGGNITATFAHKTLATASLQAPTLSIDTSVGSIGILAAFVNGTPALEIDTIPTTINADGSFDVVVSNPATTPTTGNTTIKLTDASGQAATINSVTGTGPYTINAIFPRATTNAFFGSYALYVVVDAENATSGGTASYQPASDWSYVDVGTIDTSSEIYTQYSAGTIATGWQAVIKSPTTENSVTVTMTDDLNYTFGPYVGSTDQTTEFYAINASQTVLAEETITFDFSGGGGGSSGSQLVKDMVQDIITDISKDMVR